MPSSRQDLRTPPEFLAALRARFGELQFDASCTAEDAVAPLGYTWPEYDALQRDWAEELAGLTVYCNPRFRDAGKFAERCADSQRKTCNAPPPRVLLLVPMSDAEWYWDHVDGRALVLVPKPRIRFVGEPTGINRPLTLCCYGPWQAGLRPWRWQ